MKRKDRFTKDEIIELFVGGCSKCGARKYCAAENCIAENCEKSCSVTKEEWLEQEIEIKPRISLINTAEELEKTKKEFKDRCFSHQCAECKYIKENGYSGVLDCFGAWLKEEVEV